MGFVAIMWGSATVFNPFVWTGRTEFVGRWIQTCSERTAVQCIATQPKDQPKAAIMVCKDGESEAKR